MSRSRTNAAALARLFNALAEPVYVLDDQRRIVFCNDACRQWAGSGADDLLGQECRYHSSPEVSGVAALGAAMCPPPEVFEGRRLSAVVSLPVGEAGLERSVEFVPLGHDPGQVAGVIALASPLGPPPSEPDNLGDLSPAELHTQIARYRRRLKLRYQVDRLLGESPAIRLVRSQVALASANPTNVHVVGPPGSGRQHVARAIHYGAGASGAFVPLSCSLLGAELLQSTIRALVRPWLRGELRAGSHAVQAGAPLATLALLDAEALPAEAQAELAGFLSATELPLRIIALCAEPLSQLALKGSFRHDLACYLSTMTVRLPPLAERLEDLPLLSQCFLEQANVRGQKQLGGFARETMDRLAGYSWPGQVAELEQAITEAHAHAEGHEVLPRDLPPHIHLAADAQTYARRPEETIVLEEFLAKIELELIQRAMAKSKGNKTKAARLLGMTRPRLYRRLVQLGLEEPFRPEE